MSVFRRDRVGFICQEFNRLDTLTVYGNMAIARQSQRCAPKEVQGRVREAAEKLGIEDVLDKYPYQISGGQKQRTAAARAIVTHPSLILADEPTGALDSRNARQLLDSLEKLNREENAAILMVTHVHGNRKLIQYQTVLILPHRILHDFPERTGRDTVIILGHFTADVVQQLLHVIFNS